MKILKNLSDVYNNFEVLVFDANGVLWNGENFFPGIFEFLSKLILSNKIVYIFSNSTFSAKFTEDKYANYGLKKGIHYTKIITNGEIVHDFLKKGLLKFSSNSNPIKYYNPFFPNNELFKNTKYKEVKDIKDADFIYIGIPRIHHSQIDIINKYSKYLNNFNTNTKTFFDTDDIWYDTLSMEPFFEILQSIEIYNLPVLNINPDFTAKENGAFVIRQGSIAQYFKTTSAEVIQFGKPAIITFEGALNDLQHIDKSKILMIGDSIPNDIVGAKSYGIKSALVLKTGLTANEVLSNNLIDEEKLNALFKDNNVESDFLLEQAC